ncbi:MAG: ABC transporter permease, partial [Ignavibacteriaceae bacterium]|nr:ABC transporter permease [Ignavibacteriaceae bacterium]
MNNIFKSGNMKILFLRILSSLLTLFLLVSLLFFLIRLSPGDPSDKYISAKLGNVLSKKVEQEFSLNQPITQQYISFVSNIFRGELGISYNYHQPVFKVIWEYFSFTIIFALLSFSIQISLSIWLAIKVSRKKNRVAEKLTENLALFVYSIPAFVLGVGLILIFSVEIDLLPISSVQSIDYDEMNFLSQLLDLLSHLILPLITLSVPGIAMFYKYIKESMDEVVHKTFITNLKSSGVNDKIIFRKHVLPNALKPLISVAGV